MTATYPPIDELRPKKIEPQPPVPAGMRMFTVYRHEDESGVSGTGVVLQGVKFADGKCCIQWLQGPDPGDTQVKNDFEKFLDVHIRSHPGNGTIVTFEDDEQLLFLPEEETEEEEETNGVGTPGAAEPQPE